jgi:hypothetical protein
MMREFSNMPGRIAKLPRDGRGFPIPWFVATVDGERDFRIADSDKWERAAKHNLCWICGEKMGRYKSFVIGPMCAVNRISSEPPSHHDCATFAAINCPFLSIPKAKRNERQMPEHKPFGGFMIARNPGVTLLWTSLDYTIVRDRTGRLVRIGDPIKTEWFCEGRIATKEEIILSIDAGIPALVEACNMDSDPAESRALLDEMLGKVLLELVPA